MSKKGLKENQIFAARDTVEENDKTKAAREAVAADPTNAEKYMALGLALRGQMFFREALEAYSIGLTYDPFMSLLYRHRGHAYVNLGQYQEAAADFEMGLRIDPKNWDCWYHLGLSYHLMGSYERALKAYETCYALSPTDEYRICTTDWYCMTLMKMGRIDDMRKAAARIHADMEPGMSEGYFDRVLVYNGTRNIDEVLAEAAAKDDHMYATGAYGLAVYEEYVLGNREKAKEILTRIAGRDETWGGFAEHAAADQLKHWDD